VNQSCNLGLNIHDRINDATLDLPCIGVNVFVRHSFGSSDWTTIVNKRSRTFEKRQHNDKARSILEWALALATPAAALAFASLENAIEAAASTSVAMAKAKATASKHIAGSPSEITKTNASFEHRERHAVLQCTGQDDCLGV